MLNYLVARPNQSTTPIYPVAKSNLSEWLSGRSDQEKKWVADNGFTGQRGTTLLVPGENGGVSAVLLGVGSEPIWSYAALPKRLPKGRYQIEADLSPSEANDAALGWALGCYRFDRYLTGERKKAKLASLVWPENADRKRVGRLAEGIALTRDLITTPAEDMGPAELASEAKKLAKRHGAKIKVIVGTKLLEANYPAVHAVGRAAVKEPRLIDIRWGNPKHPKITLVGKGVCFDSGGLDLKSAAGMKMMKKDMGGAGTVLGLAHAVMDAKLKVRLRVLVPAVENAVSGNAFRPLDILPTRKGITIEVGNTDAEGRLILSDALCEADSESPELIIDMATLTGAARVALGAELPALFSTDEAFASETLAAGIDTGDPLWRMPLHTPYRKKLDSRNADISNISSGRYGGAITAALFLNEFVSKDQAWMHIDTMAYNQESRAGRPRGGEAFGLRALYTMLERRYPGGAKSAGSSEKASKKQAGKTQAGKKRSVKKVAKKKKGSKKKR